MTKGQGIVQTWSEDNFWTSERLSTQRLTDLAARIDAAIAEAVDAHKRHCASELLAVANAVVDAIAEECEACAKRGYDKARSLYATVEEAEAIAAAIRARGGKP